MSRTWIVLVVSLVSFGADAATVYRCHTAHGVSYQDQPCVGRDSTKNLVTVGEPSVVKSTRADNMGEWADQLAQDNRKRELQNRAEQLQRSNEADTAEFAAMVETLNEQKSLSAAGAGDVPPVQDLEQRQLQMQQDYRSRMQTRNAELQDVQSELNQSQ